MPEYIGDLVEYLRYSFAVSGKLWFDLQVESINLDLQQAVPVGLSILINSQKKIAYAPTPVGRQADYSRTALRKKNRYPHRK